MARGDDDDRGEHRARGVALVLVQLGRRVLEKRTANDLHAVQWSALRYFGRAGRRTSTIIGLSRFLGNTTGSASRTVKSLTERGLVEGTPSRLDARSVEISLTPDGTLMLDTDPIHDVAAALGILSPAELTQLAGLLDKVDTALGEAR